MSPLKEAELNLDNANAELAKHKEIAVGILMDLWRLQESLQKTIDRTDKTLSIHTDK